MAPNSESSGRQPVQFDVRGEFGEPLSLTATPELADLLDLAARINLRATERFNYSFSALLLALIYGREGISTWFKDFIVRSGADLGAILSSQQLAGQEEALNHMANQSDDWNSLYPDGRRSATASSLAWLQEARRLSGAQQHANVGLRHFMGAVIFDAAFHAEDFRRWKFDRSIWASEYLQFVAAALPQDLGFWQAQDARVFPDKVRPAPKPQARPTYLFTWNPRLFPFDRMKEAMDEIRRQGWAEFGWSTGTRDSVVDGARVFFLRHGEGPKGLVGAGFIKGGVTTEPHWDLKLRAEGKSYSRVMVSWEFLSELPVLTADTLTAQLGAAALWNSESGGVEVPPELAQRLEGVWANALASPETESSPPPDGQSMPDATREWNRVAGFQADTVGGEDQLDIRQEALNLAMVVAHKEVQPPISVGLFGDWGSGKSFFMDEMNKLIAELSKRSRERKGRFCENIVQLNFNAWHYMDSNLWASLAREIFEGLATAVADRENRNPDLDLERERLNQATRSTKDLIAATEARVGEVQRQLQDTQQLLARNQREVKATEEEVIHAALETAFKSAEVQEHLQKVAAGFKLDQVGRSADEIKVEVEELAKQAQLGRSIATGLRQYWKQLVLVLVLVALGSWVLYELKLWFNAEITTFAASVTAICGTVLAAIRTVRQGMKAAQAHLDAFKTTLDNKLAERRKEMDKDVEAKRKDLESERGALDAQRKQQEAELERLKGLSRELDQLDASRQLVDFIRQRDASSDYRDQLGVVARASQDFKRLSDLMDRSRKARERVAMGKAKPEDEKDARIPHIERIVLYIDDLDRCPEDKVVDVLQAVHLLLAYRLFVVVVGVDPRWLLHSLEKHSGAFQAGPLRDRGDDDENTEWRSTSLNYLEKIFQIPYTLRPMSPKGFKRLVDHLSGSRISPTVETIPDSQRASTLNSLSPPSGIRPEIPASIPIHESLQPPTVIPAVPSFSLPTTPVSLPVASPIGTTGTSERGGLDVNPAALELEERERAFMAVFHELIPTPRAAKRFVNVYRLIRASLANSHELRSFLETREYIAVQVLLAMVTGAPAETSDILGALLAKPEHGAWTIVWWDLVDEVMRSRPNQRGWRWLEARLESLRKNEEIPRTCEGFRKWADDVARYSFYSGRILLQQSASLSL